LTLGDDGKPSFASKETIEKWRKSDLEAETSGMSPEEIEAMNLFRKDPVGFNDSQRKSIAMAAIAAYNAHKKHK
jgi:hypothetical protein